MKIYRGLDQFEKPDFAIVTSGTFDGVHLGHQKIISRILEISQKNQGECVVITFWPHPRVVLSKGKTDLRLLTSLDEKAELLDKAGIHHLLVLPFTPEFSQLSPEEFIQKIYIQGVGTRKLVIGYDHRFGKNREGGFDYLTQNADQYPFTVEEIPRQDIDDVGISSTKIRKAIQSGDIALANQYLGYPYSLTGLVIHGDKLGRTIGFPTANLEIEESYKLIPNDGIYAVKVSLEAKEYQGMLYIGNRPTLEGKPETRIEVNILDFDREIYGANLRISLIEKIRGDAKFDSLEAMILQLKKDEERSREVLK